MLHFNNSQINNVILRSYIFNTQLEIVRQHDAFPPFVGGICAPWWPDEVVIQLTGTKLIQHLLLPMNATKTTGRRR